MYACMWQDGGGDQLVTGGKESIFSLARILSSSFETSYIVVRRCDTGERTQEWNI